MAKPPTMREMRSESRDTMLEVEALEAEGARPQASAAPDLTPPALTARALLPPRPPQTHRHPHPGKFVEAAELLAAKLEALKEISDARGGPVERL